MARDDVEIVRGVCPHDCPDSCAWQVAVDRRSGRAIDLWGDSDHPVTGGHLCTKVDRYLERTYHAQRLTKPLRRVGAKGQGRFEEVGWDEALAEVAARLRGVVDRHGAESILPYSYGGTMGLLQSEGMAAPFFAALGASKLARTICATAGFEGFSYTVGATVAMDTPDFAHAELILLWGTNTLTSNLHLWPFVLEAKKRGARVIAIDPIRTRTARACDEWIAIRPGTDGALALAIMHELVAHDLVDHDYIERHTTGFAPLIERLREWTPERAAAITGVSRERIVELAASYGGTRRSAIRINYGMQRHAGGGMAVRTIACLPALTGAWRERGGGIQLSTSGAFRLDLKTLSRPELQLGTPRTLNMSRLGDALAHDSSRLAAAHYHPRPADPRVTPDQAGPPVHALVVYNSNPAAVAPDQASVLRGLSREDLFTVVLEQFPTDTVDYADIVLPATTQLEHWDILKPYGHLFLSLNRPAIAPLGEARPNSEIFRGLARAMGISDPGFERSDEQCLREFMAAQTDPWLSHMTWEELVDKGYLRLNVPDPFLPYAEGGFRTRSGKCEFFSERMQEDGYDPLPTFDERSQIAIDPSVEAAQGEEALSRGLVCLTPPAHSFLNSSFVNVERLSKREKAPYLLMHPSDAQRHGVGEGDRCVLRSTFDGVDGQLELTVRIASDVVEGSVVAPGIWWNKLGHAGAGINQITPQGETDMGGGAVFYDARVTVVPLTA